MRSLVVVTCGLWILPGCFPPAYQPESPTRPERDLQQEQPQRERLWNACVDDMKKMIDPALHKQDFLETSSPLSFVYDRGCQKSKLSAHENLQPRFLKIIAEEEAAKARLAAPRQADPEKPGSRFVRRYDRFQKRLSYAISYVGGYQPVPRLAAFTSHEPDGGPPTGVLVVFHRVSYVGWQYLKCHSLGILVDDEPLRREFETRHDGTVISGSTVFERVGTPLRLSEFLKLADAGNVEVRLCNLEFKLNRNDVASMSAMAAALRQIAPASRPAQD